MTLTDGADSDTADQGPYWNSTKMALTLVVIAITLMWGWIYLFAPRTNPDRLESRAFAEAAELVCSPYQAAIDAMPTGRDVETVAARNQQIIDGTVLTEDMVADLRVVAETHLRDAHDRQVVDAWFDDWEAYIEDRWSHVDKLERLGETASDRDLRFILRDRAEGGIYTRRLDGLANVNDMSSCHTPLDI